jgi:hypothetical protein
MSLNDDRKSDERDEYLFYLYFWYWLGFQIYLSNSLKSICRLTVRLIDERMLICDHSQLVNIIVKYLSKIWTNVCLLLKIFVVNFDRGRFLEI